MNNIPTMFENTMSEDYICLQEYLKNNLLAFPFQLAIHPKKIKGTMIIYKNQGEEHKNT